MANKKINVGFLIVHYISSADSGEKSIFDSILLGNLILTTPLGIFKKNPAKTSLKESLLGVDIFNDIQLDLAKDLQKMLKI